jgi:hypothetical protein
MNKRSFLSRLVEFFRAGYPADAPELGYVALIAMCPVAADVTPHRART